MPSLQVQVPSVASSVPPIHPLLLLEEAVSTPSTTRNRFDSIIRYLLIKIITTCVLHSRGYTGEVTAVPLARGPRPGPVDALQIVSPLVNTVTCYLVPQSAQSARLVAAPRQRGRRPARAAAAGGQRGGRRRGLRQVRLLAHELPEVLLSAASAASACVIELETKVHPKIRNHGEGPY